MVIIAGHTQLQHRELVVTLEAYVKREAILIRTLTRLALELEKLIAIDHTLGGLVKDIGSIQPKRNCHSGVDTFSAVRGV